MNKYYILYNTKANNGHGKDAVIPLLQYLGSAEHEEVNLLTVTSYSTFFSALDYTDRVILVGGDGTLNHFLNDIYNINIKNELLYFPAGTGNDFQRDLDRPETEPISLDKYIKNLPSVTVNGKTCRFLNGIGYGIDGYCCEVGDKLRAASTKKINYTSIAIKGLLFHFKPCDATITVDGVEKHYHKVWLAPTMNGRFYGGGMMVTPEQDRLNSDHTVSICVLHGSGKLKTLLVFPSIFTGKHIKHTDMVDIRTGHEIRVQFSSPCALQIDGETVLNVNEYAVNA